MSRCLTFASRIAASFALLGAITPATTAQVPGQIVPALPLVIARASDYGLEATIGTETLSLVVCSGSVVHVITRPDGKQVEHPQPWLLPAQGSCKGAPFEVSQNAKEATLSTVQLRVTLSLDRGNLVFKSAAGKDSFASGLRSLAPTNRSRLTESPRTTSRIASPRTRLKPSMA